MLTTTGKLSRTGPWPMASLGQHDKWQTRIDRPPIKVLVGRRMFFMTRNEHPECLLVWNDPKIQKWDVSMFLCYSKILGSLSSAQMVALVGVKMWIAYSAAWNLRWQMIGTRHLRTASPNADPWLPDVWHGPTLYSTCVSYILSFWRHGFQMLYLH